MKRTLNTCLRGLFLAASLGMLTTSLSGCGGGGGGGTPAPDPNTPPPPPSAPTVAATPANAQAALNWSAVTGATSYNVYTSATSPVTSASAKTTVTAAGTTVAGLSNGTPLYAAVTAVGPGGESALSNEVCAMPTAASTTGVTLYDSLCASSLDGAKWQTPLFTRAVVNGAMSLSAQAANMEAVSRRGLIYTTTIPVNDGGQRVTTLQTTITVPAATAARTGGAEIRANIRIGYQPPAGRLFPVDNSDLLLVEVGLRDAGNGLRAFRDVIHCDNALCIAPSASGVSLADPSGFTGEAAASYDVAYVFTVSLNEATGIFSWTIVGGALNLAGSADPTAYLSSNAKWSAVGANPLVNGGYVFAGPRVRLIDSAGGSSGRITASFDDVKVGFDNAAATAWDDFSAAGGNSGPTELSAAKWSLSFGKNSMTVAGGSLFGHAQATTPSSATLQVFNSVVFSDPTTINTMQADFTPTACSNTLFGTLRIGMGGSLYNDGTAGTTPPNINQSNSRVGDISVGLFVDCKLLQVRYQVSRFDTHSGSQTILGAGVVPSGSAPIVGSTHTLRMKWDPAAHLITFQANGQTPLVVDPTTANANMSIPAPYVKTPNVPTKNLSWFLFFPNSTSGGALANVDFKANNVFTAP